MKRKFIIVAVIIMVILNAISFFLWKYPFKDNKDPKFEVEEALPTLDNYRTYSGTVTDIVEVSYQPTLVNPSIQDLESGLFEDSYDYVEGNHLTSFLRDPSHSYNYAYIQVDGIDGERWFWLNGGTLFRHHDTEISLGDEVTFGYYNSGRYAHHEAKYDSIYIVEEKPTNPNPFRGASLLSILLGLFFSVILPNLIIILTLFCLYLSLKRCINGKRISGITGIILSCLGFFAAVGIVVNFYIVSARLNGNDSIAKIIDTVKVRDYYSYLNENLPEDSDFYISNVFIGDKFSGHARRVRICIVSSGWINLDDANEVIRLTREYLANNPQSLISHSDYSIEVSNNGRVFVLNNNRVTISMVPETISIDDVYDDIQDVYIYTNGGLTEEQYESFRSMFPNAVITYK